MKTLNRNTIKKRRLDLGITLKEMAEGLGFKNSSTYLKYENGTYAFKADHLPFLAEILKCEIDDFFAQNVAKIAT
ncbi:transcriptional regulator [Priestia filamentosa]|uniref:Transcriptional regulator n=1 Tax=Priestia filamentosa TaxID=1402861 RepID=A0A0H4KWI2_9BACI|nr:helix-turn-helix transcriptional regulator [Priestia filamentosa]AKO92673.1 transcriptional regulator [Priestia filamentosa]